MTLHVPLPNAWRVPLDVDPELDENFIVFTMLRPHCFLACKGSLLSNFQLGVSLLKAVLENLQQLPQRAKALQHDTDSKQGIRVGDMTDCLGMEELCKAVA